MLKTKNTCKNKVFKTKNKQSLHGLRKRGLKCYYIQLSFYQISISKGKKVYLQGVKRKIIK